MRHPAVASNATIRPAGAALVTALAAGSPKPAAAADATAITAAAHSTTGSATCVSRFQSGSERCARLPLRLFSASPRRLHNALAGQ